LKKTAPSEMKRILKVLRKDPTLRKQLFAGGEEGERVPPEYAVALAGAKSVKALLEDTRPGKGRGHGRDTKATRTAIASALGAAVGIGRRKVSTVFGLSQRAVTAGRGRRMQMNYFAIGKPKRGRDAICDEMTLEIATFMELPDVSTISPSPADVRTVVDEAGNAVKVPGHIANFVSFELHTKFLDYIDDMEIAELKARGLFKAKVPGIRAFQRRLAKIRWLKMTRSPGQRLVCCCTYHTGMREIFIAWSAFILANCTCEEGCPAKRAAASLEECVAAVQCPVVEGQPCTRVACCEGLCGDCGVERKLPECPCEMTTTAVGWRQWDQVVTQTKRGNDRETLGMVAKAGTAQQMGEVLRSKLVHFVDHDWKTNWIRPQRQKLWSQLRPARRHPKSQTLNPEP
jgi:hypothetical protein